MYKSMMLEFPVEEYRARVDKLIAGMQKHGMDAILLSSKENTRYFSGLQSIVWDSKIAVPGLLIVTANGDMTIVSSTSNQPTVTVTSCIEPEKLLAYSRTSEPGFPDTFPKAVAYALEKFNVKTGRIGMEIGHGFRVAMSHADQNALMALNRWYREGYMLAENYGWTSASTEQEWALAGKAFVCAALTNYSDNFDAACMNAGIDYTWTPVTDIRTEDSTVWTTSTGWRGFFITKNCSNPEAAIKAAKFLYSKDTGYTMLWGIEGTDWQWNEDHTIATFNYGTEDYNLKKERQLYWGWLGHDGISNNMAYASNEKTRMGLNWVGSITNRNPVLGLIMNSMDAESREFIIYQQLVELEDNSMAKIATAATAEEAEKLYNEMLERAASLGAGELEAWANEKYPQLNEAYNAVRSIGAEGWNKQ